MYYEVFNYDDEALLESSVGHCCTVVNSPFTSSHSSGSRVVFVENFDQYREKARESDSDSKISRPTPIHHEYIARKKTSDLKRPRKNSRNKDIKKFAILSAQASPHQSILSTSAIDRFARFSSKFKEFSHKQAIAHSSITF